MQVPEDICWRGTVCTLWSGTDGPAYLSWAKDEHPLAEELKPLFRCTLRNYTEASTKAKKELQRLNESIDQRNPDCQLCQIVA